MSRWLTGLIAAVPRFLLCLITWGVVLIFLAGVFGGFDFTDEGGYYLSFVHPENVSDNHTSYYIFGGKLFALLGHSIVALRVCTLCATFGGTLIFLGGWRRFLRQAAPEFLPDRERWILVTCAALIASFLGYGISPLAFSYNFQNAFCLLAASGFLLGACAQTQGTGLIDRAALGALAGFGALVGLEFFVKFSSSVVLAVSGSLVFLVLSPKSLGQKAALGALLLLCLAVIAVLYFSLFQSFAPWWHGIFSTAQAVTTTSYVGVQGRRYTSETITLLTQTLRNFVPVWAVAVPALLIVPAVRAKPRWQAGAAALAGSWIIGHLLWLVNKLGYSGSIGLDGLQFFLGSLILLLALAAASYLAVRGARDGVTQGRWRVWIAGSFLFGLPYIGAFGTSNNINTNCTYQLAPWLVLAALLLAELDHVWRTAWPTRLGTLLLGIIAASQFYQGYWLQPYRVTGSRSQQTLPTAIGEPATTLRLDPGTHEFIISTRHALQEHGFKAGDDLIVLFDLPGLVFALGGVSPGHPWYFHGDQESLANDSMRLRSIEPERRKRAFIVCNGFPEDSAPLLRECGLNFPADYQLITPPMLSPFTRVPFEIWAPVAVASPSR